MNKVYYLENFALTYKNSGMQNVLALALQKYGF